MISLDFIFAFLISFGMSAILFAMSITLSVVEITQYITYSSARAHALANVDPKEQENSARSRYRQLIENPALGSFYRNSWFQISPPNALEVRGGNHENSTSAGTFQSDYPGSETNRPSFMGVRTTLTANILDLNLPMLGKTDPDQEGFSSRIVAMIIREPSQVECQRFINSRFDQINNLDSRYSKYSQKQYYYNAEDNGC
jgi:hypothetical protein